jgi:UDP-N-acetylglucosamine 2-epimerase (non-hydrolysing)
MPYTLRSKEALVREGIERRRIFVTGNPIYEVIEHYRADIDKSRILDELKLRKGNFVLATLHRAENVDEPVRLGSFMTGLARVAAAFEKDVIVSVHPRTAARLEQYGLSPESQRIRLLPPMGLFDFVHLEKSAFCVLSDSGTVQEECCILNVPNVTLRDVTERPETIEAGSNILSGADPETIERAVRIATDRVAWSIPAEYIVPNVSQTVTKIVLGYFERLDQAG